MPFAVTAAATAAVGGEQPRAFWVTGTCQLLTKLTTGAGRGSWKRSNQRAASWAELLKAQHFLQLGLFPGGEGKMANDAPYNDRVWRGGRCMREKSIIMRACDSCAPTGLEEN